ncbi:MAG TPA: GNAT family N-acetyltransferase [Thermoanaerobaculia bacterium]|nr:GNAT family N-acetyltransferase [Thermoanaerobaculia bacterium]
MREHVDDELQRAERIRVRGLRPEDFEDVVAVDQKNVGRRREEFFRVKLAENLAATGIRVSLAAELDGAFVGFLLARVLYGEFGRTEPAAVLDTLAVHPDFQGQGVGTALLAQLRRNLAGLGVGSIQTEVAWRDQRLMAFFQHEGFRPAARFALDLDLSTPSP